MKKMWAGRFEKQTDPLMERMNRSLDFDCRMYSEDIQGSEAYALALQKAGVITRAECAKIRSALGKIRSGISSGKVKFLSSDEDIHMAVERLLSLRAGKGGAKIHTGRSRNDQVATDTRLYAKKAARRIHDLIKALQSVVLKQAQTHQNTMLPGYTHLQRAQPVSLGHYLLSFFFVLERDLHRMVLAHDAADTMPLGSGALAGSAFSLDRKFLARELGFRAVSMNSMDAVSDRDFLLDFLYASAVLGMHLSRYAEDFIIWSSSEFGFLELSDAYATGSSMMPQKKNPDSLELVRGKCGRIYANLFRLLTVLKGLPLTYAKDLQEDKEPFFDSVDTLERLLPVFSGLLSSARFRPERMEACLSEEMLATDIADFLTRKGVPFREAHGIVGRLVLYGQSNGKGFPDLTAGELSGFSSFLTKAVMAGFTFRNSLENRNIPGGTGPGSVRRQLAAAGRLWKGKAQWR